MKDGLPSRPSRGWGPFRETWLSVCSQHSFDSDCHVCRQGWWDNDFKLWASDQIYRYFPRLWEWWIWHRRRTYKIPKGARWS